ncbi:hypothetical protein LTR09_000691 [Extremus antarcticus]|uniref:Uncharacterized protein n=1 Tax=Extremus antarcticus TaxID=702011 RepID=A0AAJ0GK39_9PEZI|nr:hypothetical protein LTR09_000691 [Extremus antarcticus]
MQFRALALALAHASVALAVCGAGQIGVGTGQLCQLTSVTQSGAAGACGSTDGRLFATDCNLIATTTSIFTEGFCGATWDNGASVDCDAEGNPTFVRTSNGNFDRCQSALDFGNT